MQQIHLFKKLLLKPQKTVITTHHKPDADALGSSLGLAGVLKKLGHEVSVITPSDYPDFLAWMYGNEEVINFENNNQDKAKKLVSEAELIFCLDFNCLKRINSLGEQVDKAGAIKILIDHHLEPDHFANYEFWDVSAAATCQIIYNLIEELELLDLMDTQIAECLYAGIMTDTGQFKHPNTTKEVHLVSAKLIDHGVDVSKVSNLIYDNNSIDRLRFTGYIISQKMTVNAELNTTYFVISASDLKKFRSKTGDTEGVVNYGLSIRGMVLSVLIIEREDGVKLSMRSRGEFSVNEFARKYFNGGGHRNAAGGSSELSLADTVNKFEKLILEHKDALSLKFNI
ncbi:MAG: bifunctional oligoribonuclease/PAP phosphatase NrnA [Cyclobacteriaceae bacterium]|nr:bifunctional oligoribonuclease/PAP phosphatase NrnA [Cyclobacteriaceae bacterium]